MSVDTRHVSRRSVVKGAGLLALLGMSGGALSACGRTAADPATWPDKPITLLSGYNPGGSTDVMGQGVVSYMNEVFDQTTKIEFMPGSSGLKAAEYVLNRPADGYTQYLRPHTDFEFVMMMQGGDLNFEDFRTVGCTGMGEFFVVVNKNSAYKSLQDVLDAAAEGGVNYASSGAGSGAHIASAQLAKETGTTMTHVPFEGGGPALEAILGNHVDFLMATLPRIEEHLGDKGRLAVLACCGAERSPDFPDLKTLREDGYEVSLDLRHTVSVHHETPEEIVSKLTEAMKSAVDTPEYAEMIELTGYRAEWQDPEEFEEWSASLREQYTPIMEELGLLS